jgi:hypothetical protein
VWRSLIFSLLSFIQKQIQEPFDDVLRVVNGCGMPLGLVFGFGFRFGGFFLLPV